MAATPTFPPLDGSISVLPGFVDFHAEHNPDLPWAVFPSIQDAYETDAITFSQFARATHRAAQAFCRGRKDGHDGEVVSVILHCDTVLYVAALVGLVRAGFVPFLMSPKNSSEGICYMLEKTASRRILSQSSLAPLTSKVCTEMESKGYVLQIDEIPALSSIFPSLGAGGVDTEVELYPSSGKPHDPDDLVLYIHSSGSTGFPKPIPQRQKQTLNWCCSSIIVKGRDRGIRWASMHLPTFHTIGMYMQCYAPLTSGYPFAVYTPQDVASPTMPTPKNVLDVARVTGCTGIPTVPAFLEAWAQSDEDIKFLMSLKIVAFAGGPLSDKNGNKLAAAGVPLFAVYGGTEFGAQTDVLDADDTHGLDAPVKTSADWAWFTFGDRLRPRWVPQGDGTYELQYLTCETHCPAIENLEDVRGYATNDLFMPHPTKTGLWKITGRKDDVIVLGSGEKLVPLPQEGTVGAHPMVAGAVMFGRGKNEAGILIELHPQHTVNPQDEEAVIQFRNLIWPTVEEANRTAPSFGRIFKEMILVADPVRPFPRAGKGTFIRGQVLALYEKDIEQLYQNVDDSKGIKGIAPPVTWNVVDIEAWLSQHASTLREHQVDPAINVFDQGFDSLSATFLRNRIIGAMHISDDLNVRNGAAQVPQNLIFDHPTLRQLAQNIAALINPASSTEHQDRVKDIQVMLAKYSKDMPQYNKDFSRATHIVVLLTGSTGNIGCHVLQALLLESRVSKVYTLNRASTNSQAERQSAAFKVRNLPVEVLQDPKLIQLSGDLTLEKFGLEQKAFDEIKGSVTHIVHNAWKVDFNHPLASFEPHIAGTRKLIDECSLFEHRPRVLFSSSIAAVQGWDVTMGIIPEEPLSDPSLAIANGYGSSKYVAEQLLKSAAQNGLETTTLRIGQVCGSKNTGAWSPREWVPILVKSSLSMGIFPEMRGLVSWIPMDAVSFAIVDVVVATESLPLTLNVVHPRPALWREIMGAVDKAMGANMPFVSYKEWLVRLERIAAQEVFQDTLDKIPAIKLLGFFRMLDVSSERASTMPPEQVEAGGSATFSTALLRELSPYMRDLEAINESYAERWMSYWRKVGFLTQDMSFL